MFDNREILRIALEQSAAEMGCEPEDFLGTRAKVFVSRPNERARCYLKSPLPCDLVSYGGCVIASAEERYIPLVESYIKKYPAEHCFETPNMHILNDEFQKHGMRVCFMAEYWLPDIELLREIDCGLELRVLTPEDFSSLYLPEWGNALYAPRRERDVLAVGAYDGDRLIGLAGCSADCETMWQIGVDVLPEYRRRGVVSAATARLALETLDRGKVPFYCCAWSNIRSARNAIRSGFRPAWVELTVKPAEFTDELNK